MVIIGGLKIVLVVKPVSQITACTYEIKKNCNMKVLYLLLNNFLK